MRKETIRRGICQCQPYFGLPAGCKNGSIYADALGLRSNFAFTRHRGSLARPAPCPAIARGSFHHQGRPPRSLCLFCLGFHRLLLRRGYLSRLCAAGFRGLGGRRGSGGIACLRRHVFTCPPLSGPQGSHVDIHCGADFFVRSSMDREPYSADGRAFPSPR